MNAASAALTPFGRIGGVRAGAWAKTRRSERTMKIMNREETLRVKLEALLTEHRRLDEEVDALSRRGAVCSLELQRLKKRRLALKDQITLLRDRVTPDIIA